MKNVIRSISHKMSELVFKTDKKVEYYKYLQSLQEHTNDFLLIVLNLFNIINQFLSKEPSDSSSGLQQVFSILNIVLIMIHLKMKQNKKPSTSNFNFEFLKQVVLLLTSVIAIQIFFHDDKVLGNQLP